ncbi:MAG: hypothetical protein JJT85_11540 [Chromatiales bacterium]|nr:hypothetical protein [Chromatiales bacterium]
MITLRSRATLASLLALLLGACATMDDTSDFDRHRYSQLVQPFSQAGVLFFDVTYTAAYPEDDPAAEQARMQWLAAWLRSRGACSAGFEIIERRPFEYLEDNPRRHDQRYELRCR